MFNQFLNKLFLVILLIIIISSFTMIDYSNLYNINGQYISNIISGMLQPDWSYIYEQGSTEDLISLIFETVMIALYGTGIGTILSIPVIILSSFSLWENWTWVAKGGRAFLNLLRAIPTMIYAILFVRIVGPGAFAGGLAIGTQLVGMLGKLIAEAVDNVDRVPLEALTSSGSTRFQTFQYAHLPQVLPIAASHILNHFEISVRSATILGLVGAGGIGAPIIFALQSRDWPKVSIILLAIILVVLSIDALGSWARKKLA